MIVKVQQSSALLFILFGHADEPIFKETRKDRGGRTQDLVSATVEERRGFLISAPVLGAQAWAGALAFRDVVTASE